VDMGVETDDVDAQRVAAIKAIDDAKGRIVESELKKLDRGPARREDRRGHSARQRRAGDRSAQAAWQDRAVGGASRADDQGRSARKPGTKLERGDTHIVLSLYNLATVAPRQTSNLNLAAADVEQAYNAILERVTNRMAGSSPAI